MLPSLQMGWTGREVLAGGKKRDHPPPPPPSPGQVARRARTLVAGSAVAMAGSPGALGAASAARPPPLGSGSTGVALPASGCSGLRCSVELPAPMALLRFSHAQLPGYTFPQIAGTWRRARSRAPARSQERLPLPPSSSERAQTANERDALAANSLKEKKKKSHLFASSSPLFFPRFIT